MVRVAGLRGLMMTESSVISDDGLTPGEQLIKINELSEELVEKQQIECRELLQELKENKNGLNENKFSRNINELDKLKKL